MIHQGENIIGGMNVEVERKRIRRINLHVKGDGAIYLSVPKWWATLHEAEDFLHSKWDWVLKTRERILARKAVALAGITEEDRLRLELELKTLNSQWAETLCENGVIWKIKKVKTYWGLCNWRKRTITYNLELARAPRELIEYVVVHELTHLVVHNHGPQFYALMDARLPDWKARRAALHKRQFALEK